MARPTVEQRAGRLLLEHRVTVVHVDDDAVRAIVRGTGRWHRVEWRQVAAVWTCTCQPERAAASWSHAVAVRTVTTVPPGARLGDLAERWEP